MGSGSYGAVWKARQKSSGKVVAIKIIDVKENGDIQNVIKEIQFLEGVDNPNVVHYYESYLIEDRYLWVRFLCSFLDSSDLELFSG